MKLNAEAARRVAKWLGMLFHSRDPVTLGLNQGYIRPPEREAATMRMYDPETKQWGDPVPIEIVYATVEEEKEGLACLRRFLPGWQAGPGLLWLKPNTALFVTISACTCDSRAFRLDLKVEEVLLAPSNFDPSATLSVTCLWNQPMLSVTESVINAPYDYRMLFGKDGVEAVRSYCRQIEEEGSPGRYGELFALTVAGIFHRALPRPPEVARALEEARQASAQARQSDPG